MSMEQITFTDFTAVEMRVGTIIEAQQFPKAHKPAYVLQLDFGEFGVKKSSAQITDLYSVEELIGRQVIAVCNFPPKQIADLMSECLILGLVGDPSGVVLIGPDRTVKNGLRVA
ncbi:MAG: tRNA-binding protein [Flavobacteriales bacterium]|nr:tRNA-binding protein [Flavobacteriales bacterium]